VRWRKVFPGQEDQVREVRRFVAGLLADHPNCDDIVLCAAELATNAIRHTASGRDGSFVTEVSWTGQTARVAVGDEGAPTAPFWRQPSADIMAENDRGLDILARLSASCGADGDDRGRVVWAEFPSTAEGAHDHSCLPLSPQPATSADAATLAGRYAAWHTWFGHWTGQWWALAKQPSGPVVLIAEPTAGDLARRLDTLEEDPRNGQLPRRAQ
jgi:anti-sigma regulatory factor (Ser/Thr protein kinase)